MENGINAQCIYKGDVFKTVIDKYGVKHVVEHEQKFENIKDVNIIGAYAVAKFKDGSDMADVMTIEEIKKSWAMSKNNSTVHANFSHEMACKTVISRLAKQLSNATDDRTIISPDEPEDDSIVIDAKDIIQNTEESKVEDVIENVVAAEETTEETPVAEPIETTEEPTVETSNELICQNCGKTITKNVSSYSISVFGKPLCMNCQKGQKV